MVYNPDVLHVDKRTVVALKYIERMHFPDGEELTIDVLKGDLHIEITMVSGEVHSISMNMLRECEWRFATEKPDELRRAVYEKWAHLLGRN